MKENDIGKIKKWCQCGDEIKNRLGEIIIVDLQFGDKVYVKGKIVYYHSDELTVTETDS